MGRPGSGKSTVARYITKLAQQQGWATTYIGDYEILHKWFMSEQRNPHITYRYFRSSGHNGFDVEDFSILREALEEVKRSIKKHLRGISKLIVVEFARDDYSELLEAFDDEILDNAYFVFLHSDIDTCIERINKRVAHPATIHDHFVSEKIIRSYYGKDSRTYMLSQFAQDHNLDDERVKVIDNTGSRVNFMRQIKEFTDGPFKLKLGVSREPSCSLVNLSKQELNTRRRTGPLSGAFPSVGKPTMCL